MKRTPTHLQVERQPYTKQQLQYVQSRRLG